MLKDMLDQLGSLTLEEKRAVEEAARAAVARELGAHGAAWCQHVGFGSRPHKVTCCSMSLGCPCS